MKFNVYAIRDVHTGFMSPTFEINHPVAIRNFNHAVQNSDSILFTAAKDFDLYQIGTYDSDDGKLMPLELPLLVCKGSDCL